MTLITVIDMYDGGLEWYGYWQLALMGYWREGLHHSGHIAYHVQKTATGT